MKSYWSYYIATIAVILLFFSCQNEESLIGDNLLNDEQYSIETYLGEMTITTFSEIEEGVNASSSTSLLGSYLDPIFGQTNASFVFQITPPSNEIIFDAQSIQNIYLTIPYIGFYGEDNLNSTSLEFTINISQLTENINLLEDPSSNETNFSETSIPVATLTKTLSEIQEVEKLELNLTPSGFGLNEILNLNEDQLASDSAFLDAFNGFEITVEDIPSINGGIMYFDTASDSAFLHVEYADFDGNIDTVNFAIGSQTRLNSFRHNYINDEAPQDSALIFLQSMGGVVSKIQISELLELKNSGYIAVNDAILSIRIDETNGAFPLPEILRMDDLD